MAYSFGEVMGKVRIFKLQKIVTRLISNVQRDMSYRKLFKTLNIFPVYYGICVLHKIEHRWDRAKIS
jgi:hypothetical protein